LIVNIVREIKKKLLEETASSKSEFIQLQDCIEMILMEDETQIFNEFFF
jgi:hypothetical protein